ncbi:MAG TPA: type II CAAX endopeptidase family protein [Acidobacteriaceae bacterium]|nr:type II CAAX endopeptidase family protein [Acidobacteriaceae bacterium]
MSDHDTGPLSNLPPAPSEFSPLSPQPSSLSPVEPELPSAELTQPSFETPLYTPPFLSQPAYIPVHRTPNFADLLIFSLMLLIGFLAMLGAASAAAHYHWFGLKNLAQMQSNTRFALGTEAILYGVTLACSIPIFRMAWSKSLLSGLHWHQHTAWRLRLRLAGVAVACNLIAMLGNAILPFPQHAPIDKMFSTTSDAWLLMVFGVTVAPFFEELIFRGFLLPAFATTWDWSVERLTHRLPRPLDAEDNPVWSLGAQIFAALIVSAPFALMHAEQVGNSWGPVLLLYCVSLILCAVRLRTRSLACSTLVHSCYNFLLFAVMLFETDGFRHLDKM